MNAVTRRAVEQSIGHLLGYPHRKEPKLLGEEERVVVVIEPDRQTVGVG